MINNIPQSQHPKKLHYQLQTKSLKLKPYYRSYIHEYHNWFTLYPELLHLTATQNITLQQQIQNHRSWVMDISKYTFVIFYKQQNCDKMIGDINIFFSQWIQANQVQINIMIALPQYRGKGLSKEVMDAVQLFIMGVYQKNVIIAKIKMDNFISMKFFEKIGYLFIQDNLHHGEKQYRKQIMKTKEQALHLLKTQYNMKQISNAEELFN